MQASPAFQKQMEGYGLTTAEILYRMPDHPALLQSYEQARIGEVRDTPVITVVGPPVEPALPDSRLAVAKAFLAGVVGFLVALVVLSIRRMGLSRRRHADVAE